MITTETPTAPTPLPEEAPDDQPQGRGERLRTFALVLLELILSGLGDDD